MDKEELNKRLSQAVSCGILKDARALMPKGPGAWKKRSLDRIVGVCLHQNGANNFDRPLDTAKYHTGPNHIDPNGMPSTVYNFMVPDLDEPAWLTNEIDDVTWAQGDEHTPGSENEFLLSVLVMGNYDGPGHRGSRPAPSKGQMKALETLLAWLQHTFGFGDEGIFGHLHFGKPACLTGDTRVPLLDGSERTLKDLCDSGEKHWFYSAKSDGSIYPGGPARVEKTGDKRRTLRVVLDNDKSICCTPDHLFMLSSGEFIVAESLRPGMSLMPLRRRVGASGYESVFTKTQTRGRWVHTHLLMAHAPKPKPVVENFNCHHKDGNKRNNEPTNLQWLPHGEHTSLHLRERWKDGEYKEVMRDVSRKCMQSNWQKAEFREKIVEATNKWWTEEKRKEFGQASIERWKDSAYQRKIAESRRQYMLNTWESSEYRGVYEDLARKNLEKFRSMPENEERRKSAAREGIKRKWAEDAEFGKKARQRTSEIVKRLWKQDEYAAKMSKAVSASNKRRLADPIEYRKAIRNLELGRERGLLSKCLIVASAIFSGGEQICEATWASYKDSLPGPYPVFETAMSIIPDICGRNHKVAKIEAGPIADVYDVISCTPYNNFALSAGVFVHNCPGFALMGYIEARREGCDDLQSDMDWQLALLARDPLCLPRWGADGDWGTESQRALISFQRDVHFSPKGFKDPFTELLLLRQLRNAKVDLAFLRKDDQPVG